MIEFGAFLIIDFAFSTFSIFDSSIDDEDSNSEDALFLLFFVFMMTIDFI